MTQLWQLAVIMNLVNDSPNLAHPPGSVTAQQGSSGVLTFETNIFGNFYNIITIKLHLTNILHITGNSHYTYILSRLLPPGQHGSALFFLHRR